MSFTVKFAKELELFFQWTILNGYIICGDDKEQRLWDFKLIKDFKEPGRNKLEFYLKTLLKNECMIYFKGDKISDAKLLVKEFKCEEILKLCEEHLGTLSSMQITHWDDTLQKMHSLFDCHIDAQRQWIYLEGLFGNDDLKSVIPAEVSRFQNANLKKIKKANLSNLCQSTLRIVETLEKIQKALGDYLEKQRAAFPRFYFIDEEDLLEIIGNVKDITRVEKHLSRMFAGIHALVLESGGTVITAIKSVPIEKSRKSSKSSKSIKKEIIEIEIEEIVEGMLKVDNCVDTSGGYFLCTLEFSTEQLVKILGEPIKSGEIDDEHVFEWRIVMNKEVFSIYDWENTVEFNKIVWHISGEKSSNVCNVKEWISKSLENVTDELEFDLSDIE